MSWNTPRRFSAMLLVAVVTCNFQPTVSLHVQRCVRSGSNYYRCNQNCRGGSCTCHASDLCDMRCNGGTCKPILCDSKTCDLSCIGGRCTINCRGELCKVTCTGGVCPVTCHSTDRCNIMCIGGRCKPILCTAKTCDLLCTGGSCEMDCKGEHCNANCTGGRCTFKCPANAKTCNLRCTGRWCNTVRPKPFRETTALTVRPTVRPQIHNQRCYPPRGCVCPRVSNYYRYNQICRGGSCPLTCHASDVCDMSCTGGNCKPILCDSKTCDLSCTGGGCEIDCKGEHCKASCAGGRCTLKCPANAKTCNLRCTGGLWRTIRPPRTALTTVTPTNPQPTIPHNQLNTFQTCANLQGGCRLTCPRRSNYSSCQ